MEIKCLGRYMVEAQIIMSDNGEVYYQEIPSSDGYEPPEKHMKEETFNLLFSGEGRLRTAYFRVEGIDEKKRVHLTPINSGGVPLAGAREVLDDWENCTGTFQLISASSVRV